MNKWKQFKKDIKNKVKAEHVLPIAVYELNYNHVVFKLNNYTVYDIIDNVMYVPQTGII